MAKVKRKRGFFALTWKILLLSVVIYALNIIVILQLIPVFESSSIGAKFVNAIIFPVNFIFEDLFGIEGVLIFDILTWVLQFFYAYIIACILRRITKVRIKI
ncbi:hypothetical protein HYV49_04290 [Candidatus Pacearchaeota archaeon]|nr:hypothetical protein [Candidatus Pacearchaeota archaeon]